MSDRVLFFGPIRMDFERIRNGGSRKSTAQVKETAMGHFKNFLEDSKIPFINRSTKNTSKSSSSTDADLAFKEQEAVLCIWQKFGTYLCDFVKKSNGEGLSSGTGKDYLGQAKECIRLMYENNPIWKDHSLKKGEDWLLDLKLAGLPEFEMVWRKF